MNNMECELLPCPFCGGNVDLNGSLWDGYYISCQCRNLMTNGKKEVVEAWNTRKSPRRSIESAPKDEDILVYGGRMVSDTGGDCESKSWIKVRWKEYCGFDEVSDNWIGGWDVVDTTRYGIEIKNPTYWTPLPDAPEEV